MKVLRIRKAKKLPKSASLKRKQLSSNMEVQLPKKSPYLWLEYNSIRLLLSQQRERNLFLKKKKKSALMI